jgi:hypothetical protein
MPRALSVDRKERGSVLSTLEIEPRTPTVKLNCINVHPRFSGSELKKSNTGAYRASFSASVNGRVHSSCELQNGHSFTLLM